jgi:hypothetical protein
MNTKKKKLLRLLPNELLYLLLFWHDSCVINKGYLVTPWNNQSADFHTDYDYDFFFQNVCTLFKAW